MMIILGNLKVKFKLNLIEFNKLKLAYNKQLN